jgi:hypothetical protein
MNEDALREQSVLKALREMRGQSQVAAVRIGDAEADR